MRLPVQPTEMRSFNAEVVVRMLDLVSAYFDNVVIDMPLVPLDGNRASWLYIVSEMTVPCLRHGQRLIRPSCTTPTSRQSRM